MNSKVSICIPVYNGEDTIGATIESVLNQTYKDIEIIIVDNASIDSTVSKIKNYDDDRIRVYINDENLGMVGNWNKCLEYVSTDWVHFLCADDVMEEECIEKKMNAIKTDSVVMVYSASEVINDAGKVLMSRHQYNGDRCLDGVKLAKKSFRQRNLYGEPSNVLFKKSVIEQIGVFCKETCYVTDWEFWLRVSTLGEVIYLDDVLVKYRISGVNTTSKLTNKKMLDDDIIMIKKIEQEKILKVTVCDKIIHRCMYVFRMYARAFYMKIKC